MVIFFTQARKDPHRPTGNGRIFSTTENIREDDAEDALDVGDKVEVKVRIQE